MEREKGSYQYLKFLTVWSNKLYKIIIEHSSYLVNGYVLMLVWLVRVYRTRLCPRFDTNQSGHENINSQ
jgi:hypothetical protein